MLQVVLLIRSHHPALFPLPIPSDSDSYQLAGSIVILIVSSSCNVGEGLKYIGALYTYCKVSQWHDVHDTLIRNRLQLPSSFTTAYHPELKFPHCV